MIDVIQLHDALRFSGFGPDVPFHAADSAHELKLRKVLSELGDASVPDERDDRIAELELIEEGLESDLAEAKREIGSLEGDVRRLNAELRARSEAAVSSAEASS
jgi:hypothetical protein